MGVIFVAGVHGVGKTTCCQKIATEIQLPYYSASALIKAECTEAISQTSKVVANVAGNQDLLITAVTRILAENSRVLLDGHFTVLNEAREIERIPEDVFVQLSIDGIILYRDDPAKIYERATARDGAVYSKIASHQLAETNHAEAVAAALGLKVYSLAAFDVEALRSSIADIWRQP